MNDKKAKIGVNAVFIVGLVFTVIGAIFLVLGIIMGIGLRRELGLDAIPFLFSFGGMGLLFFVLGLVFLITLGNKKKTSQRLLDNGNYVVAEIFDISQEYNVTVNGRHPYIVNCKYEAIDGTVHILRADISTLIQKLYLRTMLFVCMWITITLKNIMWISMRFYRRLWNIRF